tara:strand:- start:2656 stop:2904 length:249 start_codon:yes stop_codon:yes gene_type:complete
MSSAEEMSLEEKISLIQSYGEQVRVEGSIKTSVEPRILERLRHNAYPEEYRLKSVVSYRGKVNEDRLLLLDILFDKIEAGIR